MADFQIRNTVGARNPFVLADIILGTKTNWSEKKQDERIKHLERAFGRPYSQLFDPSYPSPLFSARKSASLPNINTGDTTACNPDPCPAIEIWNSYPGGVFADNNTFDFNDPIQGCLPNCYFVAALVSYVWATPDAFLENLSPSDFQFYKVATNPDGTIDPASIPVAEPVVTITDKVPLRNPATWIHSRSNTIIETWPALYEKAFAVWKHRLAGNITDEPAYSLICRGNPLAALISLTGKRATPDVTYFQTKKYTSAVIFSKIRAVCTASKSKYPMVAWTYDPSTPANAPPDADVKYNNDVIVGNHSYSVLGIQVIGANNYIVLRNPWGQKTGDPKKCDPAVDPNKCNPLPEGYLPVDAYGTGNWIPIGTTVDSPNDGIFSLRTDYFKKYFQGFGWVK